MPPTSFTRHAWVRVRNRLSLTPIEVAAILNYDLAIPIGEESGRTHKLFFSPPDDMCFVAVQDEMAGAIVTVLPLDYHSSWTVSQQAQDQARKLLFEGPSPWRSSPVVGKPTVFRVGCYFLCPDHKHRVANLGSMPLAKIAGSLANVLESDDILTEIEARVEKARRSGEELTMVFVRIGQRGDVMRIHLGK